MMTAALLALVFNDGVMEQTGAALNYSKNKDIQMVREVVKVAMNDEDATVQVDFTFKNHGKAQTVKMGFPEEAAGDWSEPTTEFKSWVDGKSTKVEKRKDPDEEFEYKAIYLKSVSFRSGQTRQVRVSYRQKYSGNTSGADWFRYIFTTGATWSGRIQSMKIIVDASKVSKKEDIRLILAKEATLGERRAPARQAVDWKSIGDRKYEGEIKNVKPDFNLVAYKLPGFWRFEVDGWPTPVEYAIGRIGPVWPKLEGEDAMVPIGLLGTVFGAETVDGLGGFARLGSAYADADWDLIDPHTIKFGDKTVKLKRSVVKSDDPATGLDVEWVYVRDFIEGFGGTYRFDKARRVAVMTKGKR